MGLTNSEIKFVRTLHLKKNRLENRLFIVEGEKMINELIHQNNFVIDRIFGTELIDNIEVTLITNKELERISHLKNPNKFLALVRFPENKNVTSNASLLMVDRVNDPGNLGTIIRTADWFGIEKIIVEENSVDLFNPKVVQSTMGAIFRVQVYHANLLAEIQQLKAKGYQFYGAFMEGENYKDISYSTPSVLVMGSESHGISSEVESLIDHKITIPRQGKSESLNLGVATGILLAEFTA